MLLGVRGGDGLGVLCIFFFRGTGTTETTLMPSAGAVDGEKGPANAHAGGI